MQTQADVNYFVCTLGQAAQQNERHPHQFTTINEFIDVQARDHAESAAVGFALPRDRLEEWRAEIFTFRDLRRGSVAVAKQLQAASVDFSPDKGQQCVALLCPSSADFLFAWLGLMRAGCAVLLIAPQCQPEAIAHLCRSCDATLIFHDSSFADLAQAASVKSDHVLRPVELPWQSMKVPVSSLVHAADPTDDLEHVWTPLDSSVAYIHHTSGTSTGLPKPIPQSNRAGVGVLPCLKGASDATFTTTPLYHGGVADCFRAWTSEALIWLFPGADLPITTKNVISCLTIAEKSSKISHVKYFSSVPYILQMLADDEDGLRWLQRMDIVGVGGAALPPAVGDRLVQEGVHLVSRFGSAECGFLLSSHRKYASDHDWQYLRQPSGSRYIRFEEQADGSGLSELVVLSGWPHMAKTNREDGSLATSDLFEPHPTITNAWRYHSRSDSQLTLITGKKFDPAPIEDTIAADLLVQDCLIFGTGRQAAGVLIWPSFSAREESNEKFEEHLWNIIQDINNKGQDHTRISRDMIVITKEGKLLKSSKGTVLRASAEKEFAAQIEAVYSGSTTDGSGGAIIPDNEVEKVVREIVHDITNGDIDDLADFYHSGVDSSKCTRIRALLQKRIPVGKEMPWNVVYDCGNIRRLSSFLQNERKGNTNTEDDQVQEMLALVERYSVFEQPALFNHDNEEISNGDGDEGQVVILTGATGALGAHMLDMLKNDRSIGRIHCLVRANDDKDARCRVSSSLQKRRKRGLDAEAANVDCWASQLDQPRLGLSESTHTLLQRTTTIIIHAAWPVNFSLSLQSFVPQFQGLHNLIALNLVTLRGSKLLFCSSTASVLGPNHPALVPEDISSDPMDADKLGYSRSKWVGEAICTRASHVSHEQTRTMHGRVMVARIGQLTGDTQQGVWNMSEAYPLMLSTVVELGCLPDIRDKLSWLPLDLAAQSLLDITLSKTEFTGHDASSCQAFHVLNNHDSTDFADLLRWLKGVANRDFEIVEPSLWLSKLEALESHPAKALLGLWRRAYGGAASSSSTRQPAGIKFEVKAAEGQSPTMQRVRPVDEDLFRKIWTWLVQELETEAGAK